jgi:hypothetical protein
MRQLEKPKQPSGSYKRPNNGWQKSEAGLMLKKGHDEKLERQKLLTRDEARRIAANIAGVAEAVTTPGLGATGGLRARGATPDVADTSK